jgi:hypothetical protein
MELRDTSAATLAVYRRRLAEMTPRERVNIGVALWQAGDSLQRAAVRRANPEAGEEELVFLLAIARFGEDLARRIYGKT